MQPDLAQTLILHSIASHQILAYVIVFILLFLEGDAILFGIAFLAHRGFLDLGILVPLVFFGAFFSDLVWYAVGRRLDRTWPWLHVRIERVARHFDRHLTENPERTIMIAKFIYGGICRALIMRAGSLRVPVRRFAAASLQGIVVWMFVVGGLGILASAGMAHVAGYLKFAEISLAVAVIIFVAIQHAAAKRLGERL